MTDKEFYEQIKDQAKEFGGAVYFGTCLVSLTEAAQALRIQPSDILELISDGLLNVRDCNTMTIYGTELNDLQKIQKDWLATRKSISLNNVCQQFFGVFPDSDLLDKVRMLQKLHVPKNYIDNILDSLPTPLQYIVFDVIKNA